MIEHLLLFFALLAIIIALVMVSNRLKVAYPVLLVLGGLAISFVPNLPSIKIDPELIFIIFLPPLLYEAAWANSLKELFKWRRMIGSFAFIVVFISAAAVAVIANLVIPGFSLALGFMLGAIVSPPDAVSTAAILKFVKAPRRISAILEGESLLNDASSLIIFRFAAVAVTTGQFIWYEAAASFVWMVVGGVLAGLVVALAAYFLHKILPTDENSDTIMTITTPYIMYILAEELGASGVLAVVCGGLYLSTKKNEIFTASTRIHAVPVWNNFIFLLNGLAFTMIGLDLPEILSGLKRSGVSLFEAVSYGVLVCRAHHYPPHGILWRCLYHDVYEALYQRGGRSQPRQSGTFYRRLGWHEGCCLAGGGTFYPCHGWRRALSAQRPHLVYNICRDLANAHSSGLKLATAH